MTANGLHTKTVLEHLVFLYGRSIVQVCRELTITPQQFSDWIKMRRPIPEERLETLEGYFGIDAVHLADGDRYARRMSALSRVEIELLVMEKRMEESRSSEERERCACAVDELKKQKERQVRIARLSAGLDHDDPAISAVIDSVLDLLEQGDVDELERRLKGE